MNHGLSDLDVAQIRAVFAKYAEVESAVLYGSRAKGTYKPGSDVDIALVGDGLTSQMLAAIQDEMEQGLLPYRFDLSVHAQISHPGLQDHIKRVGVLLYQKTGIDKVPSACT